MMGHAKYVGRIGALAVALGIGTAVVSTPGIAWADGPGASSSDGDTTSQSGPGTAGADVGGHVDTHATTADDTTEGTNPNTATTTTPTTQTTTTQTTTTQTTATQATTTVGGGSTPTVTFGNSSNTGSIGDDVQPPVSPSTEEATTVAATPTATPSASQKPTATPTVEAAPAHDAASAAGASNAKGPEVDPPAPAVQPSPSVVSPTVTARQTAARSIVVPQLDDGLTSVSNTLRVNTFSALAVPDLPVPTAPQPSLIDTVLALPGTLISTALNLITQALAPVIGPGAPADNPVLWGILAFVRRQFTENFANATPALAPRQTSQDLDDDQVHGTFGGTDADGDTLTYAVPATGAGAPVHGTVAVDQATGTFTYTPTAGFVGEDYFFVTASDSASGPHTHALGQTHLATARVDVTVTGAPVNVAPTITATPGSTDPGTGAIRYTVATLDTAGDTVTVSTTQPAHGTLVHDTTDPSVYVFTPDPTYAHALAVGGSTVAGSDDITFTATDSAGATGTATAHPAIAPVNSAPTLVLTTEATGAANGAVKVTITYADADGDALTGTIGTPQHGSYFSAPTGGYPIPTGTSNTGPVDPAGTTTVAYYVPDPTRPGVDTLSFSLVDSHGGTVTKTAQVTVDGTSNHAPTIGLTSTPTGLPDGSVVIAVTIADADADDLVLTLSDAQHGYYSGLPGGPALPNGITGTVHATAAGETQNLYYTPDPTQPGVETVVLTVTDGSGATASATVTYTVTAPEGTDPQYVGDGDVVQILEIYTNRVDGHLYATVVRQPEDGDSLVSVYDVTTNALVGDGYSFDPTVVNIIPLSTALADDSVVDANGNVYHNVLLADTGNGAVKYDVIVVRPDGSSSVLFHGGASDIPLSLSASPAGDHVYLKVVSRADESSLLFSISITDLVDGVPVLPAGTSNGSLGSSVLTGISLASATPVDAEGRVFYIDAQGELGVLDTDGASSTLGVDGRPLQLGASQDGYHVFAVTASADGNNGVSLDLVDLGTGETVALGDFPIGPFLQSDLAVSDDGSRVLVISPDGVLLVDMVTHSVTSLGYEGTATDVMFSSDGTKAYVVTAGGGDVIQTVTLPIDAITV